MEKLKVGDKVYLKSYSKWGKDVHYKFGIVERLTKTQAVLDCGTRLINEPKADYYTKNVSYGEYGDTWTKWKIQTPQILEAARIEGERQKVVTWFENKKFNEDEMKIVYEHFKSLGLT